MQIYGVRSTGATQLLWVDEEHDEETATASREDGVGSTIGCWEAADPSSSSSHTSNDVHSITEEVFGMPHVLWEVAAMCWLSHPHMLRLHKNILLDGDGNVKVSDFRLSVLPDSLWDDGRLHTACGTPTYAAPEVFCCRACDGAKADAWSCGVVLFPVRHLVSRLLDSNPNTCVAVESLVTHHPWFKRSLSVDSQLDGLLNGQPEHTVAFQAPTLNVFDIISMSPGLNLSRLFGDSKSSREKRFMTMVSPERTLEQLGHAGRKLGYVVVGKKGVESGRDVRDCGNVGGDIRGGATANARRVVARGGRW
ncbi:hypothetical protein E2562_002005 [Oryza meyeriana var. granulata]|uniref:non-specific serine/threonine protein kinase n=1 Tax=Oryza meyeriana var. granulata TaxID=110450 RepID=A0A6G1C426_9ORYZ|nr:hypothetical protein E2562_002005 [Oryza meyeriana var. granulata]